METSPTVKKSQRFEQKRPGQKKWYYRPCENEENVIIPVFMTWDERMERERNGYLTLPDGREAKIDIGYQIKADASKMGSSKTPRIKTRARWPLTTVLTGVGEDQVDELRQHLATHGVKGTTVNPDGSVTWESKRARYDYCRAVGLYDRNAGYSDPAPLNK